jgi:transcriptional regulator with XRE-family HTH domain
MVDMDTVNIGNRIRTLRTALKMSQEELGNRAGVSKAAISAIESGRSKDPKLNTFFLIARTLGVDAQWLASGDGEVDATGLSENPVTKNCVVIRDDSMSPNYPERSKIFFKPAKAIKPGQLIVVEIDGEPTVRRAKISSDGSIECIPLNEFYPAYICRPEDVIGVATKHVVEFN